MSLSPLAARRQSGSGPEPADPGHELLAVDGIIFRARFYADYSQYSAYFVPRKN
jgi:hypothetical protein